MCISMCKARITITAIQSKEGGACGCGYNCVCVCVCVRVCV